MGKSNKHISKEDFTRYLNGEMDNRERNEFERTLEANPFEKEALEGMGFISTEEFSSDLDELKQRIISPKKRSSNWHRIAAVAAILILGAGTTYTLLIQKPVTPTVTEIRMEKEQEERIPEIKKAEEVINLKTQMTDSSEISDEMLTEQKGQVKNDFVNEVVVQQEKKTNDTFSIRGNIADAEEIIEKPMVLSGKYASTRIEKTDSNDELSVNFVRARQNGVQALPTMLSDTNPKANTTQSSPVNFVVSGLVISGEDSSPLPGAAITLKGSKYGTMSDSNGRFNLELPAETNLPIVASFVGMETTQISDYSKSGNVITLEPDISGVSEVVVTSSSIESEQPTELRTEAEPNMGYREFYREMKEKCLIPENYTPARKGVKLKLTISKNGAVSNIEAVNSPDSLLLQKSIELIKSGPTWIPAKIEGNPVKSTAIIKLRFHE